MGLTIQTGFIAGPVIVGGLLAWTSSFCKLSYDVPEGHRWLTFVLHTRLDLSRTLNLGFFLSSYGMAFL